MTEVQGEMTRLISLIAHPPEVLESANTQHRRILYAIRRRDEAAAGREMAEHVRATEQILGGLLPPSRQVSGDA
jgi:DNA-binding FadR family transcriptional regulator